MKKILVIVEHPNLLRMQINILKTALTETTLVLPNSVELLEAEFEGAAIETSGISDDDLDIRIKKTQTKIEHSVFVLQKNEAEAYLAGLQSEEHEIEVDDKVLDEGDTYDEVYAYAVNNLEQRFDIKIESKTLYHIAA